MLRCGQTQNVPFFGLEQSKLPPRFVQKRAEEIRNSHFKLRYLPSYQNPTRPQEEFHQPSFVIVNYGGMVGTG